MYIRHRELYPCGVCHRADDERHMIDRRRKTSIVNRATKRLCWCCHIYYLIVSVVLSCNVYFCGVVHAYKCYSLSIIYTCKVTHGYMLCLHLSLFPFVFVCEFHPASNWDSMGLCCYTVAAAWWRILCQHNVYLNILIQNGFNR